MQQQHSAKGLDALDDLSAFIRSTVTIHSLITNRIDQLQPSQQLTFKVRTQHCLSSDARGSCCQVTLRCNTVFEGPQGSEGILASLTLPCIL
jgi:hypothetical protein